MKNNAKRLLSFLIAVVMALGLVGCGKEKEPSDPNHFVIGDYELQYKGACLMTDSDGKDSVVLTLDFTNNGKEDAEYLWSVFEKAVQNDTDLEGAFIYVSEESYEMVTDAQLTDVAPGETIEVRSAYTLNDTASPVEITFFDLLEKHKRTITIDPTTLTREETQSESSAFKTGETETTASTDDALLDWWNGDWYGWWNVTGGDGEYESWNNKSWDCCANVSIGADYTGKLIIWDEDLPQDNALSEANVALSAIGTGEYGTLTSEDGYFMDGELVHADWIVDPGIVDYDDLICIDGWYEDEDGNFHYAMYLRPWGTLWDDVAADDPDNLPYYYESWYLPLVEAGKAMPDTLGGEAQAGTNEDEVTQPSGAEPEQTGTAADDEYGKSNPDAVGIAKLEDMQALYKICFENRSNAYHLFNYEDARDALGGDGVVFKNPYAWNETKHTYRWETEDGKDYFNISFTLEGDEEWYDSCNMSENVINGLW